jgi:hypothetical protein
MPKQPDGNRRKFLGGVLAGLGAAGLLKPRRARAQDRSAERRETLYRRTPDVEAYYRTLKD